MIHRERRGGALLGSLMLITVLSMILIGVDTQVGGGGGLMQVVTSEHQWVQRDYLNAAAANLAEAGLEQAMDDLASHWSSGLTYNKTASLGLGAYTVKTIASTADTYTLSASGSISTGMIALDRTLQAVVKKQVIPYTILTSGNVNFKKSTVVIYDAPTIAIHTNHNFLYEGTVSLYTDQGTSLAGVTATGSIIDNGDLTASTQTSGAAEVILPTADFNLYETEAVSAGGVIHGNYTAVGGNLGGSGITYIDGNLTIKGNVTAQGTLVVEGNVDIKGTLKPAAGQSIEVIAKGNVDIDDNGASSASPEIVASIYCEGNLKLWPGSPWIKGTLIANSGNLEFTAADSGTLRLDYKANPNTRLITQNSISVLDWREVY